MDKVMEDVMPASFYSDGELTRQLEPPTGDGGDWLWGRSARLLTAHVMHIVKHISKCCVNTALASPGRH